MTASPKSGHSANRRARETSETRANRMYESIREGLTPEQLCEQLDLDSAEAAIDYQFSERSDDELGAFFGVFPDLYAYRDCIAPFDDDAEDAIYQNPDMQMLVQNARRAPTEIQMQATRILRIACARVYFAGLAISEPTDVAEAS